MNVPTPTPDGTRRNVPVKEPLTPPSEIDPPLHPIPATEPDPDVPPAAEPPPRVDD
jgi:hypothetical protein